MNEWRGGGGLWYIVGCWFGGADGIGPVVADCVGGADDLREGGCARVGGEGWGVEGSVRDIVGLSECQSEQIVVYKKD